MGVSFVQSGGLQVVLGTNKDIYFLGEPVRIWLYKINVSPLPVSLTYPSSQRFDFSVSGVTGEVWRWSDGRAFLPVVETIVLLPGQSLFYSEIWPQITSIGRRVLPGVYRVSGWNTFTGYAAFPIPSTFIRIVA